MLGNYFYHSTVRKSVIAFGTLFNNISIQHTNDATGEVISKIKVPIAYGPIQKFLARVEQQPNFARDAAITLPRMSFEIVNYKYDASRKTAPITKFCLLTPTEKTKIKKVFMPTPYTIGFRLSFAAKIQDDSLQILEQILPHFQPSYKVSINMLEDAEEIKDIPITLTNITFRDEYEGDFTERRAIVYELDFDLKTFFYSEVPTDESGGIIKKVKIDYASAIRAPREQRYVVTPAAVKDYNQDQTQSLAANLDMNKTLMEVTTNTGLTVGRYIQIGDEVLRINEVNGTNVLVSRAQYGSTMREHYQGDVINQITIQDDALIEIGDDFGFNETRTFYQDGKVYSSSQGIDV